MGPVTVEGAPVFPVFPVGPVTVEAAPVAPVFPVGPCIPPYGKLFHAVVPSPTLNVSVSVSIPISPEASVGLLLVHSVDKPRLNCNWM